MFKKLRVPAGCTIWIVGSISWITSVWAAAPERAPKLTREILPALARQYREEGLPVPPPNAPPLLLPMNISASDDGKIVYEYVLGFRLTAATGKDHPGTFIVGTEVLDPSRQRTLDGPILPVDVNKPLTAPLAEGPAYIADFPTEVWLSTAIQCQMLGYPKLAGQILERNLMHIDPLFLSSRIAALDPDDLTAMHLLCHEMNSGDPGKALAAAAWNHWLNTLFEAATDRSEALTRLEKLLATYPAFTGREREHLLASLRLTVVPGTGKPGSPEALIDALAESTEASLTEPFPAKGFSDPNLTRLLELGFAAMPALIAHMEDERLMRELEFTLDSSPNLFPVGQVITPLVNTAAGLPLFGGPEPARQWWEKASRLGEESYVREHVFPAKKINDEHQWINEYCLWVVAWKYPQDLSAIYEQLLQTRPELYCEQVADAVANCQGLSREERVRLLHLAADDSDLERREDALSGLFELDEKDATTRLLRELAHLPVQASATRAVFSPEEEIAWLVRKSASPEVWSAFAQATQRAGPDLRAKLIERINDAHPDFAPRETERLTFLRTFIDDKALWHDLDKQPEGGRDDREPIGRRALLAMGYILNDLWSPESDTAEAWAEYRSAVLAAVDSRSRSSR